MISLLLFLLSKVVTESSLSSVRNNSACVSPSLEYNPITDPFGAIN